MRRSPKDETSHPIGFELFLAIDPRLRPSTYFMNKDATWFHRLFASTLGLAVAYSAAADTTITTFDNFNLDGLFATWASAAVDSGPTAYSITATNYGSGYKDINPNIDATGETNIELTVTLNGTGAANDPISGPIVSLVDGDGSFYNYAWYGQTKGTHVLRAALNAPTFISPAGSVPGLNLSNLDFFHLQDDPGGYHGQYTITFENLRLTGAPRPAITSQSYNPATQEFTLAWRSLPGKSYTILYTPDLTDPFTALVPDVPSSGNSTTYTVIMPAGNSGFLRVQQQ